jgi:hypothetical protein
MSTAIGEPPRPASSAHAQRRNVWPIVLVAALAGVGLAALWWFDPTQSRLPLCGFYALTGLHCPGCGATRATHELLHGRLLSALHYNALWIVALPVAAYAGVSELRVLAGGRPLPGDVARCRWFYLVAGAIALLFFALRNLPYYPLLLLAPPGV